MTLFHSLIILDDLADINVYKRPGKKDEHLVRYLYDNYLNDIKMINENLCNNTDCKSHNDKNVVLRTFQYAFEEKNIIIAIRKLCRLCMYRYKDLISFK